MPASPEIAPLRSRWLHGLSPSTARSYAIDTAAWLSWCARADVDPLRPADADLAEYLSEISGLAPSTRARRLCGIRSFYVWLHQEGIVAHVPSAPLAERPGTGADAPRPLRLNARTAAALLAAADAHSPCLSALVATLVTTGAQVGEVLALRPESLRRAGRGRTVTTLRGERGRIRTVTVPPLALERLSRIRPADPSRGFFAAPDRADPVLEQVRAAFEELARHLGISLRPQLLRDPGDIIALDRDVTAAQVAELLRRAPSGGGEDHAPARRAGRASAHAPAPRSDRRHRRSPATPSVPGRTARRATGGRGSSAGRD